MIKSEILETARRMLAAAIQNAEILERRADVLREQTDEFNAWLPEIDAHWRKEIEQAAERARNEADKLEKLVEDIGVSGAIWRREQDTKKLLAQGKKRYVVVFGDGSDVMLWATSEVAAHEYVALYYSTMPLVRIVEYQIQSVGEGDIYTL